MLLWCPVSNRHAGWVTLRDQPGGRGERGGGQRRHLVTRAAAAAVRRAQSCAKLICLSCRLRVAQADRGGIIELAIISHFLGGVCFPPPRCAV